MSSVVRTFVRKIQRRNWSVGFNDFTGRFIHRRPSLWLLSSIQVMMECGRAVMLGGAGCRGKTHNHTHEDLDPATLQDLPFTRTQSPAQRRPVTSELYLETMVHRNSPRKPHARFDHTQARAPGVAHLLSLRVGWSAGARRGGVGWCVLYLKINDSMSMFADQKMHVAHQSVFFLNAFVS